MNSIKQKYFITGGAGFIGAHITNYLIDNTNSEVTIYDNFENGRLYPIGERIRNERLHVINGDVKDLGRLKNRPWSDISSCL